MTDVDPEDAFEVPSIHDQDPVETFATYGADPPLDEPAREQRPMPTTNRLRPHEHTAPPIARKHPRQPGKKHPIGWTATRPDHLPPKHREFMTHEYLDLVRGV